jgi:UDP-N-acetylglucosamine 4,6-dehydratase/5-epimerase
MRCRAGLLADLGSHSRQAPVNLANDGPVLVTGGTGWLGTLLVRALIRRGNRVRVYARSDGGAERFSRALGVAAASVDVRRGDITDRESVSAALGGVRVVFHLAAQKSVDECEREPLAAIRTNVLGTTILLECAREAGVARIIAASTDKASEPRSVLGTTKFLMERILAASGEPPSTVVRLGGLLQSGDSVLERWKRTAPNGYIEVTDPEMTRFAMTGGEATDLLIAAGLRDGREIVAKALPAYRLGDLASAFAARRRVRIVVVGPRSGERTHESLVSETEAPFTWRDEDLLVITPGRRQVGTEPYSSDRARRLDDSQLGDQAGLETAVG